MKLLVCTQAVDRNDPVLGFFHEWIAGFASSADSVHVICLREGAHSLPGNVHIHSLGKERGRSRLQYIARFLYLTYCLRDEYDAVFVHMNSEYVLLGGLLWRLVGKRIGLWYVHGSVPLLLRLAAVFVHAVFTATPESCRISSSKIVVVGHGIAIPDSIPDRNIAEPIRLVSIGRISRSKCIDVLLDAYALLPKDGRFTFELIGGPATADDVRFADGIKTRAMALGVVYRGPMPHTDAIHRLQDADIFLSASQTGSLDKAVLEAAASGALPVFSARLYADALSAPELLVAHDAHAFAERLQDLRNQRSLLRELSLRVAATVRYRHSLERLIPLLLRNLSRERVA